MDKRMVYAVVLVSILAATLSGGITAAILSDTSTQTTSITASENVSDNETITSSTIPTATPAEKEPSSSQQIKEEGLTVSFEPEKQSITVGKKAAYDVVLEGATDGINGYSLTVELTNSSVATFRDFEHAHDPRSHSETVENDKLHTSAGMTDTIQGRQSIILGTVILSGNVSGQTELAIVAEDGTEKIDVINSTNQFYDIGVTKNSILRVENVTSSD